MNKDKKRKLIRIIIALGTFLVVLVLDKLKVFNPFYNYDYGWVFVFIIYFTIYIYIGYDVLLDAFCNIINGEVLDENFLMSIASLGAFGLGIFRVTNNMELEGFDEACAVIIFYQIGEFFQSFAVSKSRDSIASLMDIRPDYANIYINDIIRKVNPKEVKIGDIILVNPGEKIPLDGIIIKGNGIIDSSSLTGEIVPLELSIGDEVLSGTINLSSQIFIKVTKIYKDSTVAKILDLVDNASSNKSKAEHFIRRFAKIYTPLVVILAVLLMIIPSIITKQWDIWIYRSLSFLVVSCPCALVISIPLSFYKALGVASKNGILIKGSNYLEKFNKANIFVFDKTGTITKGNFVIEDVVPADKKDEILKYAKIAETGSSHPIAKAIANEYKLDTDNDYSIENISGKGVIAKKSGSVILCGNKKLMDDFEISVSSKDDEKTVVHVAVNFMYLGKIIIEDEIKDEAYNVVKFLRNNNMKSIMLTGDNEESAKKVVNKLNISSYKASLLPQEKVYEVEQIIRNKTDKDVVSFIGDGINDAPVLMRADIGISMGITGSDAAIEASDIVFMNDDIDNIIKAKKISKMTMKIVYQNIILSLGIKIVILVLSAFGLSNMWIAVFGDVGVAIIAILNALRIKLKK